MAEKEKTEGLGISGFTIGVLAMILSGWVGLIMAVVGLIFCLVQQKSHKTRFGKAGVIINIIAIVLSAAIIILYTSYIAPLLSQVSS
jgi:uncharacterized membrane protein